MLRLDLVRLSIQENDLRIYVSTCFHGVYSPSTPIPPRKCWAFIVVGLRFFNHLFGRVWHGCEKLTKNKHASISNLSLVLRSFFSSPSAVTVVGKERGPTVQSTEGPQY